MSAEQRNLNLGCGQSHKNDFINVDVVEPADIICRVGSEELPFQEQSVDYVEADNLLEHLYNEQFLFAMNDIYRVLKEGGLFWFRVPNFERWVEGAAADPTHKMFFVRQSIDYFTNHTAWEKYGKSYGFKKWKLVNLSVDKFLSVMLKKVETFN